MAVRYQRIVEEDLDLGTGVVDVVAPGGGTMVGHRIGPQTFAALYSEAVRSVDQSFTGGDSAVAVALNTEVIDVAGWFDPTTYKFTPTIEAVFQVNAYISVDTFNGKWTVSIAKNDVAVVSTEIARSYDSGKITLSGLISLNGDGDYVTLIASHNDGTNSRNIVAARIDITLIGR